MKGFIHVVEILVISLAVFAIIMQFGSVSPLKSDWQKVRLTILGQDALLALDKTGINWLDANAVESNLTSLLGNGSAYSLEIVGVPPSNISIGCNCTSEELNFVRNNLTTQTPQINGQNFSFYVEHADRFDQRYDLWLTFSPVKDGAGANTFLSSGKGIMEISHLTSTDDIQKNIFGLNWSNKTLTSNNLVWSTVPANESWPIYKYFHTIPNSTGQKWPGDWQFSSFLTENIEAKNPVLTQPSGLAGLGTNSVGAGRTAWLGLGLSDLQTREDLQTLAKSLILWTAGDSWTAVEGTSGQVSISYYTTINKDFFQPIEINLKSGYIY